MGVRELRPSHGIDLPGLIRTLVRTDFKTRYHGTAGGYLWALLKPLSMFVVLMSVFSLAFSMDPDYNLNLIIGLFLWDFFAESTRSGLMSLHAKGFLLTRARFPAWVVVATSCSNALITVSLFGVLVCTYIGLFERRLGALEVALFGTYVLAFLAIVFGFSLAASVVFLRYRDFNQVWDLVLQAGFFVAPVIYPLDILPQRLHLFIYAWLPTPVIQFTRMVLVQGEIPTLKAHLLLLCSVAIVLSVGVWVYARFGSRAIEEL